MGRAVDGTLRRAVHNLHIFPIHTGRLPGVIRTIMNERDNQSLREAVSSPLALPSAYTPEMPSADSSADTVTDRHLLVVRSRLIANLGSALASWFHIVPSDHAAGELHNVALLLASHLPVLVPVNDMEAGPVFFVAKYDVDARRFKTASDREQMPAFSSLSDALLAADTGFTELRARADVQGSDRYPHIGNTAGELPEERWLRNQLARRMPSTEVDA